VSNLAVGPKKFWRGGWGKSDFWIGMCGTHEKMRWSFWSNHLLIFAAALAPILKTISYQRKTFQLPTYPLILADLPMFVIHWLIIIKTW